MVFNNLLYKTEIKVGIPLEYRWNWVVNRLKVKNISQIWKGYQSPH